MKPPVEKRPRLTIFRRLVLSDLAIFALVAGVVLYAVWQFQRLHRIAAQLQHVDRPITDYGEKLADTLLSEARYEKKYLITRAPAHWEQFALFTQEFARDFEALAAIARYPALAEPLARVREAHGRYQDLVAEEVGHLKAGRDYAQGRYRREKEIAVDEATAALAEVIAIAERNTTDRLREVESATAAARSLSLAFAALLIVVAIATSLFITRSITGPVDLLKQRAKSIAAGNLNGELEPPAIPELRELAEAFNLMCAKLRDLDRVKSEFFFSVSKKLSVPLTSIKQRIDFLAAELGGALTENQKVKMAILAEESAHLIGIVSSLVELSKMESGLATYDFAPAPLAPVIDRTLEDVAPLAKTKEITLTSHADEPLPSVKMDAAKIAQALRTLVAGALKLAAQGGSVTVDSRAVEQGVEVSISARELAGDEKKSALLFDSPETAGAVNGDYDAELGWAMAKHIIRSHGGDLWLKTNPHRGPTFSFVLPA